MSLPISSYNLAYNLTHVDTCNGLMIDTFRETGLTEVDAVALLGAHTVGKIGGFDFIKSECSVRLAEKEECPSGKQ